jgi:hypothetical protein
MKNVTASERIRFTHAPLPSFVSSPCSFLPYPDAYPPGDGAFARDLSKYWRKELIKSKRNWSVCLSIYAGEIMFRWLLLPASELSLWRHTSIDNVFVPNFVWKTNNGRWPQDKQPHVKHSGSVLFPCLFMFNGLETVRLKITILKSLSVQNVQHLLT